MHDVDCITWGCDLYFFTATSWIGSDYFLVHTFSYRYWRRCANR